MRSLVRDVRMIKFPFGCIFCRILGGVISNGCERAAAPTARFASSNPEASLEKRAGTSPGCGVFYGVTHVYLLRGGVISFRSLAWQKSVHIPLHIPLHIHLHIHIHTHLHAYSSCAHAHTYAHARGQALAHAFTGSDVLVWAVADYVLHKYMLLQEEKTFCTLM